MGRVFANEKVNYLDIYHKFLSFGPINAKSSHLFQNYRNKKFINQVIGKGAIENWPSKITEYFKLKNLAVCTGYLFRQSLATLLANNSKDLLELKRHIGWTSSTTVEGYIEQFVENNIRFTDSYASTSGQKKHKNRKHECSDNVDVGENPLM